MARLGDVTGTVGEMMKSALDQAIRKVIAEVVEQEAQAASERVVTEVRKRTAGIVADVFRYVDVKYMENRIVIELKRDPLAIQKEAQEEENRG